ncbi:unnamed protein product [Malus fusca]
MCKCRSHGTFPLFGLQSSHLNICYYHQDLHRRPLRPGSRPRFCGDRRALLLIGAWRLPRRPGVGRALQRHPFSGLVDSADGPNGELAGRRRERAVAKHAGTARAAHHDRVDGVSAGISTARALAAVAIRVVPRPEPIGGPACDRSTSDRGASPAPIRFPPDNFKHSLTLFSKSFSSFPRGSGHNGALTLSGATFQWTWARSAAEDASPDYNSNADGARFSSWAVPGSLAVTRGILLRRSGAVSVASRSEGDESAQRATEVRQPPIVVAFVAEDPNFMPTARGDAREAIFRPSDAPEGGAGGQRRVTPRQACPRPDGFGRNLRSKTRWFTGFCNSHQVSHFATFFIDARAEISVAESRFDISKKTTHPRAHRFRGGGSALFRSGSLAQLAPVFVCTPGSGLPGQRGRLARRPVDPRR